MARSIYTGLNILPLSGDTQAVLIRGIGDTSSTNALLIQDSGATQTFAVRDDGSAVFGSETLKVIQEATLSLLGSDSIGSLFTSPQVIVAAPASGKAIQVISASMKYTFDTAAFTSSTNMRLIVSGLTYEQASTSIAHTASVLQTLKIMNYTDFTPVDKINMAEALPLRVDVETGNPSGGSLSSVITIKVQYVIIDV